MRTRYGISVLGLILASGAGVYLGAAPVGYVAMAATAFVNTPMLAALPGALVLGALVGAIVGYGTRHKIRPQLPHRYRRFVLAGVVTMPGCLFVGQFPSLTTSETASQWALAFVLSCGVTAMVVYYQWRKRLTLQHHARRVGAHTARQQAAAR